MINKEQFLASIKEWIFEFAPHFSDEREEIQQLNYKLIKEMFDKGYSRSDVICYLRCCEEINPTIDEETALKRMKKITDKYPKLTYR